MATLREKDIEERLIEWSGYQLALAEIQENSIGPIQESAGAIEKEISDWLKTTGKEQRIETDLAVAALQIEKKFGSRKIDVHEFLGAAAAADKDSISVERCLTVAVAKAEKLLGETEIDKISERPLIEKPVITVAMK